MRRAVGIAVRPAATGRWTGALVVVVVGSVALAARSVGEAAAWVAAAVGVAALLVPVAAAKPASSSLRVAALVVGLAGFGAVRLASDAPPLAAAGAGLVASAIAGVAEEAFFRRLTYGWLARWGPAVAIAGAAVLFAAIHVPMYGSAAIPLNLGAGLVLGWQRWATGGWAVPAVTHAAANVMMAL